MTNANLTIEYEGTLYASYDPAALRAAGVSSAAIADAQSAARRELIKAECRRRIYSIASAEAQINISGAATIVSAKTSSQRSAEETAMLATYGLSLQWIMDMRAAVEALDADTGADFTADAAWPACPTDVIALAEQF